MTSIDAVKDAPRARTYEESMSLIDRIIGRCVREEDFGRRVLEDPHTTLAEYGLNHAELSDFIALKVKHAAEAAEGWAELRAQWVAASGG